MSTFLELVQDLHRECGAAGAAPSSVASQVGEYQRLVKWVIQADRYVQSLWTDWKFLWSQTSGLTTTATVATLAKPSDLNFWDYSTFVIGGDPIPEDAVVEYHDIRGEVLDTSEGKPSRVIILPNDNLQFEPVPDDTYTVTADYWRKPTSLAANADVSAIPEEFHPVILGRALILYANYENAPEVKTQGEEIYIDFLARLENSQLPNKKNSRFRQGGFFEVQPQ